MASATSIGQASVLRDGVRVPTLHETRHEESQSYLNRLTRAGLLTADEEVRLALKIARGGIEGARAKHGLVECNMRLVVSIAKTYRSSGIPFEDLIQEGAIGLMTATERFDPHRGFRFSTYATQWIRQAIGRAVDNKSKSIRIPAHVSESLRKLERIRAEVRRETGEEPTLEVLSERLGVPIRKIDSLMKTIQEPISLDTPRRRRRLDIAGSPAPRSHHARSSGRAGRRRSSGRDREPSRSARRTREVDHLAQVRIRRR